MPGVEHARSVVEGSKNMHCEKFMMHKLLSRLSLFFRVRSGNHLQLGPAAAKAQWKLSSWGMRVELSEKFKKGVSLSKTPTMGSSVHCDPDVFTLESSESNSTLLGSSSQHGDEEVDVAGVDDDSVSTESTSATPSHAYWDILDVMDHASKRLSCLGLKICLNWPSR